MTLLEPGDTRRLAWLCGSTLVVYAAAGAVAASLADIPLSRLGAYHDGHLYIEIAKSFPLPFPPEARAYLGQAPGYPALMALLRVLTPSAWVDWGALALIASWLPAALAAGAFYLLCRALRLEPLWPSILFVVGNARWLQIAANPHAESLAMLMLLLCLVAWFQRRLVASLLFLSAAALCRFPAILLLVPMAIDLLLVQRRLELRALAPLALPPFFFALYNLYLLARIPEFEGLWGAHAAFWAAEPTWPFQTFLAAVDRAWWKSDVLYALTYVSLAFYLAAVVVGLRPSRRDAWILPLWVGAVVGFHVSLEGLPGVWDFTRLAVLAWPAALLVFWSAIGGRIPRGVVAGACAALGAFGLAYTVGGTVNSVAWQDSHLPFLRDAIRRLDSDRPRWLVIPTSPPTD